MIGTAYAAADEYARIGAARPLTPPPGRTVFEPLPRRPRTPGRRASVAHAELDLYRGAGRA
ncbi:hypothetical protein ABZV31_07700 [Streptomyces sp. NPDC005202]|uniref:hypothetical protein n=1 Tax=Streptomyces sp. NPDC005202 TaxID=3157021 RepID=UPI0033AA959A